MVRFLTAIGVGVLALASTAMAAPINYGEQWDTYAVGDTDATYKSIWKNDASVSPDNPAIWTTKKFSGANSLSVLQQNRGIDNSLTDGVGPNEMSAGQSVNSVGLPTDATRLNLGIYLHNSAAGSRASTSQYVEISMNGQHAPDPSNYASYGLSAPTDPLPNPIPVLAFGKLNGAWTGANGDGAKNTIFFFNGRQWINTFMTMGASTNGFNRAWAYIGDTLVNTELLGAGTGTNSGLPREYLGGFNTISFRYFNAGQAISGTAATDDIYLTGGEIVPEPALLALLTLGAPMVLRRHRRSA